MSRKIRGIRDSLPPNTVLGRGGNTGNKPGAPYPIDIRNLATKQYVAQTAGIPPIADGDIIANISGGTAVPIGNILSAVLDYTLASGSPAQGQILYRNATSWVILAPGTAGYFLQTRGAGANPQWADPALSIDPAVAVVVASTGASSSSSLVYNNGVAGVGATFTGPTNNTAITIDGHALALGERVLIKDDTQSPSGAFNGVYQLTTLQAVGVKPILTRATDYNTAENINYTGLIPVLLGTVNARTTWELTSTVTTIGTDPLTYSKFTKDPNTVVTSAAALAAHCVVIGDDGAEGVKTIANGTTGQVLTATTGADPAFATSPTISALLDGLSSTQGTILYRGASAWLGLAPGTAGYILKTGGAGADPSWVTGPVGSSGNTWSASAGGTQTVKSAAFATYGNVLTPLSTFTIDQVIAPINATNGHVYSCSILVVNGSEVVQSVVATTTTTAGSTAKQAITFSFAGLQTLSAGTIYMISITDTSAALGTTALPLYNGSTIMGYENLPVDISAATNIQSFQLAKNSAPAATDSFALATGTVVIQVRAQV